jgi:hypothetical protein
METLQTEAARIAAEATRLAEELATQANGEAPPAPLNYSSSVSSVTVDEDTGAITVQLVLYPGDVPITPEPGTTPPAETVPPQTEAAASGQVPAE